MHLVRADGMSFDVCRFHTFAESAIRKVNLVLQEGWGKDTYSVIVPTMFTFFMSSLIGPTAYSSAPGATSFLATLLFSLKCPRSKTTLMDARSPAGRSGVSSSVTSYRIKTRQTRFVYMRRDTHRLDEEQPPPLCSRGTWTAKDGRCRSFPRLD